MENHRENRIKIIIDQKMDGWLVEKVLRQALGVSRTLLRRAKRQEGILLNGEPVYSNVRVMPGQRLELVLAAEESRVMPQKLDLEIIYEDRDILAVNKPPGMLVHPLTTQVEGTLANGVLYHWRQQGIVDRFRPVHRLDRDTSGLVLVARSSYAHQQLARQMAQGLLTRRYLAVVQGKLDRQRGSICLPIAREESSFTRRRISPAGKTAITHFEVLHSFAGGSLVRLELETGRTHQIRVHLAYLGHPLWGDGLYGGDTSVIKRQALHCTYLAFRHPVTGKPLQLKSSLPEDMRSLLGEVPDLGL
ncbi:RluA family pseudouridine synthase [Desulforamulus ruminis]|uniref:Pseudouridine synthase n=1 Tax=Desulforamulus ruminis (strain ATCC 23193 / DSM 2154 / NCIMB 8452 / DL) TaxID=696281 RepID=F6DQK1_DESRL|nr:RluA family pseudouridine synthase [Desulforamulus ruminis]AEG60895.1 pseudouridine synthase, RluA family [Desulforamulus ruminis DSM 2154]